MRLLKAVLLELVGTMMLLASKPSIAQTQQNVNECKPFAILTSPDSFPEVQGKSTTQELWALLFPYHLPIWVSDDTKIVWRMTGTGDLKLSAQFTDGTTIQPSWGPDFHSGSNWQRPGEEWGAGFLFTQPGCWRIFARRGNDVGEIDLLVVPDPRDVEF